MDIAQLLQTIFGGVNGGVTNGSQLLQNLFSNWGNLTSPTGATGSQPSAAQAAPAPDVQWLLQQFMANKDLPTVGSVTAAMMPNGGTFDPFTYGTNGGEALWYGLNAKGTPSLISNLPSKTAPTSAPAPTTPKPGKQPKQPKQPRQPGDPRPRPSYGQTPSRGTGRRTSYR